MKITTAGAALLFLFAMACRPHAQPAAAPSSGWRQQFAGILPLLGHRNWIIIADQAFPQQNAAGITCINTNESLLPVLRHVIGEVSASGHVRPVFYRDAELAYIPDTAATRFYRESTRLLGEAPVRTILHDSVFAGMSEASKLFRVIVLKTNERIAYSSVLIQLDCAYWSEEQEAALRRRMQRK